MKTTEVGTRFGQWVVERESPKGRQYYDCVCDCGSTKAVRLHDLINSKSTMCKGCAASVARHNSSSISRGRLGGTHSSWTNMVQRCTNPHAPNYPRYGGRGITVCQMWLDSFEAFVMTVGERPGSDFSIDRIDTNGNYEPGNCRWATVAEQNHNRRDNIHVEIEGVTKTVFEWVTELGLKKSTIYKRIAKGEDPASAITRPVRKKRA